MEFKLPDYNLWLMLPELFLFVWALLVFTFDLVTKRKKESAVGYSALLGLLLTGLILALVWTGVLVPGKANGYGSGFGNMFYNDAMALFFKIIFLGAAFMAIGSSFGITRQKIVNHRGEFYGLILLSTVGMMFLSSSNELLSLYIGLELTTIPLFVLAAFFKDNKLSVEAGMKYFVIGAFSSALLLYGLSFLYGLSGTTEIVQMKINLGLVHATIRDIGVILIMGVVMMVAGIGFKLALPPFHQWAPDVYEGSPTPIAAFLSVGSKAAGLVAFAKIFVNGLIVFYDPLQAPNDWGTLVGVIAVLAMVIGNVVAIRQSNIKRMLAYSSIAQAGYIMIGMVSLNEHGLASVGYYIFAYMFANMGAFAAVAIFEDKTGSCQIESYRGLAKSSPFLSVTLAVFLLSLAGIPPLAGFLAKYKVFAAAISMATADADYSWLYWLVGVGLLTAVFSLFYYANVIKQMFFSTEDSPYKIKFALPSLVVLLMGLVGVFWFGIFPEPVLDLASDISAAFGFLPR
ncbi:MAG: NADH-quinone oxidoreductase subunit N [Candidatus Zixiibacteriota bacterium]|nr:MAG: NADH-quinone oxidoreductase subunit N [candidate division Zixibacteria bacterium]